MAFSLIDNAADLEAKLEQFRVAAGAAMAGGLFPQPVEEIPPPLPNGVQGVARGEDEEGPVTEQWGTEFTDEATWEQVFPTAELDADTGRVIRVPEPMVITRPTLTEETQKAKMDIQEWMYAALMDRTGSKAKRLSEALIKKVGKHMEVTGEAPPTSAREFLTRYIRVLDLTARPPAVTTDPPACLPTEKQSIQDGHSGMHRELLCTH